MLVPQVTMRYPMLPYTMSHEIHISPASRWAPATLLQQCVASLAVHVPWDTPVTRQHTYLSVCSRCNYDIRVSIHAYVYIYIYVYMYIYRFTHIYLIENLYATSS